MENLSSVKRELDIVTKKYTDEAIAAAVKNKVDKVDGKGLSTNDFTNEEKEKLASLSEQGYTLPVASSDALGGVKSGADITVDGEGNVSVNDNSHKHTASNISDLSKSSIGLGNVENKSSETIRSEITAANVTTALTYTPAKESHNHTASQITDLSKSSVGLGNVENKSSSTIRSEITSSNVTSALGFTPMNSNLKGANSGVAELDANGKVPTAQLPSYVDDVLEYNAKASFPTTGETGKIYVDLATNKTYRWSGSAYVEISPSLALGETSATAYRGDRGKTAYDHSQVKDGSNPHATTFANIASKPTTISGYGITDAKIASGVITLGSNTITPLTSSSSLNAAKLTGTASVNTTGKATTAGTADNLKVTEILETADLNNYKTAGRYAQFVTDKAAQITNNPLSTLTTGIVLEVILSPESSTTLFQILYGTITGGIYKRRFNGTEWGSWIRMATYDEVALKSHTHSYLPLSGGTLSGNLNFSGTNHIAWNNGTVQQKISINDSTDKTDNTFLFQESSDNGSTFATLASVTGDGTVKATAFEVNNKVDMKYNSTTQCLDFIFK